MGKNAACLGFETEGRRMDWGELTVRGAGHSNEVHCPPALEPGTLERNQSNCVLLGLIPGRRSLVVAST
jgi:hypothetical protein